MRKMQYFGIDFGTTNTAVVSIQDDEFGRKETFLGENGEYPFSSIVALPKDGGTILFGRKVREQRLALAETHKVYTSMKSFLGRKEASGEPVSFVVGGRRYYPKEITTAFFKHIKEYIQKRFALDIDEASFAFPVGFSPEARRELRQAAEDAGIAVKTFVSESTAAYIANSSEGRAFSKVMVLDWGGGTIDISILRLTDTSIYEESVWGDSIGGDDIDRELAERIHANMAAKSGVEDGRRFSEMEPAEQDQMIMKCEEAKISISDDEEDYPLTVNDYGAYGTKSVDVTKDQFNQIVEPIIKMRALKAIDDALSKAGGIGPASIDAVVIAGGSSNLRLFEYAITKLFPNAKLIIPARAQWSTATGAALMQIIGGNFRLNGSVGVRLSDDTIFPLFPLGHVLSKKTDTVTFALTEDAQDAHFIFTDSSGQNVYATRNVPAKGFLKERFELTGEIDHDQIARVNIVNRNFGEQSALAAVELNKLTFHYDIKALAE